MGIKLAFQTEIRRSPASIENIELEGAFHCMGNVEICNEGVAAPKPSARGASFTMPAPRASKPIC
jgi:hypothetical protein